MDAHDGKISNNPMAVFRFNNTFNTKLAMLTWMMSYTTKGYGRNIYSYKPRFCTNVSVYKAFLKDRLSFQLFVYDLFGTDDIHMSAHYGKMKELIRLYRYCPWMRGMATSQISCNNGIDKKASHVPL
jgi:hypothetical protein